MDLRLDARLARTWRQLQAGPHAHLAARAQARARRPTPIATAEHARSAHVAPCVRLAAAAAGVLAVAGRRQPAASPPRAGARDRRAGSCGSAATTSPTPTTSKRPSRASPARSASRWYERLWRGPDHFALEIHRLPDLSIRFTVAAPRYLEPAIRGPLEDLYPDVELIESRRRTRPGRAASCGSRSARSFVLSIQTTRNYEHAFSESLVALLSTRDGRADASSSCSRRRPGSCTAARGGCSSAASARSSTPTTATPASSASTPSSKPRSSRARSRLQHRSLLYFDLRVTGDDRDDGAPRRRAVLPAALRERARPPRDARCAGALYARRIALALPNPLPGLRDRRALDVGAGDAVAAPARARQARAAAARDRPARDRAAGDRARRRRGCCCATSAARSRSRRRTASTATR